MDGSPEVLEGGGQAPPGPPLPRPMCRPINCSLLRQAFWLVQVVNLRRIFLITH